MRELEKHFSSFNPYRPALSLVRGTNRQFYCTRMIIYNKLDNYFVVSAETQTFLGFEMTANLRDTVLNSFSDRWSRRTKTLRTRLRLTPHHELFLVFLFLFCFLFVSFLFFFFLRVPFHAGTLGTKTLLAHIQGQCCGMKKKERLQNKQE